MPLSAEDIPQTEGPNASMPFGDATKMRQASREMQSTGTRQSGGPPGAPGPQQPMGPPQGGMDAPPPPPVQPGPPMSRGQDGQRLDSSGVFSQWDGDGLSSMKRLEMWAAHPSKPRVINMLVDRARGHQPPAAQRDPTAQQ